MQKKSDNLIYAGFFVRLAAYLLDSIIVGAVLLILRIPFWISSLVVPENFVVRDFVFAYSIADIILYMLGAAYFVILTYLTGATVGKRALHIRVVSVEDRKMTLFEVIYRETVGRFLSGLVVWAGYFMIGIHSEKRGFHDLLADTKVIYSLEQKEQATSYESAVYEQKEQMTDYTPATYGVVLAVSDDAPAVSDDAEEVQEEQMEETPLEEMQPEETEVEKSQLEEDMDEITIAEWDL